MCHLHRLVAIYGWKHDGRGRGEAPEGRWSPALFDEKERMVVAIINRICIFAITYFTDKSTFVLVTICQMQDSPPSGFYDQSIEYMKRIVIIILFLQLSFLSFGQTISYRHGKLWSNDISLNYESINQQLGPDVLDLYKPARSEYVKGIVLTGVGSGIFLSSVLMQYALYRSNPYVFDLMNGTRPYEDWMNRHATGGMGVLVGTAASGLVIAGLGAFHIVHGGERIKTIANTCTPTYSCNVSILPSGICLSVSF